MPEETLFAFERPMASAEIADYLRAVADTLESGDPLTLESGDQTVTLEVPERPTLEVEAERETDASGGSPELSVEFELEWGEGETADGESGNLQIG